MCGFAALIKDWAPAFAVVTIKGAWVTVQGMGRQENKTVTNE